MGKLIIGVGGTGTKIVRAIRQRWERMGDRPSDVVLAVIDARERAPEEGQIPDVHFRPNQPINFSDDFTRFEEHVKPWWPPAVKPSSAINFGEGCGAIRAYGRYFAFRWAKKIIDTIDDATGELVLKRRDTVGASRLAFSVIVVGSLGNGTGGGTLFDVATLARYHLSFASDEVRCMGVFIPGAVTRKGNHGVLEQRVAASGFASLLELQYEFNRAEAGHPLGAPKKPYEFKGYDGINFTVYRPGAQKNIDTAPFDSALILDEKDRNGLTLTYPSLVYMAAEGVAMLLEGGDRDYRLVDTMNLIATSGGGKRFGSFGAARLMVPGPELLSYAVSTHTLSTLGAAASTDDRSWRDLLADETPGDANKKVLRAEEASIDVSVDFFIENVLRIKETSKGDPKAGAAFNQLFDFFDLDDKKTLREFDEIVDDLESLKDATAIVNRAVQISNLVEERTRDLATRRDQALLLDPKLSLWIRPQDSERSDVCGIKWLINARVMEFVRAGAFGLLEAWLDEMKKQVAINRESIEEHERKKWLGDPSRKNIDLAKSINEIAREADGFFRNWHRTELIKSVSMVRQEARNKFEYLLWETKANAVEAFYDVIDAHVEKLRAAAASVRDALVSIEATGRLKNNVESAVKMLDEQHDERAAVATGVKAEIPLGGDAAMRAELMRAVRAVRSASEQAVLAGLAGNVIVFADRISSEAESFGFAEIVRALPEDRKRLTSSYVAEMEARAREMIEPVVASQCSIDSVLEARASRLVDEFHAAQHDAGTLMRGRALQDVRTEVKKVAGESALDLIEQLDWTRPESREKAIELVISGELGRLIRYATPQWSLTADVLRTVHVTAHQFLTYPASARWIPRAINIMDKNRPDSSLLKAQESRLGDPMRVDMVFIEVGADVEVLRMTSELSAYRWAMLEERAFSPHLTSEYHEMGLRYLERSGDRVRQSDVVLALSEEFGILSADKVGNYKLKIEIPTRTDKGKVIHGAYGSGFQVGPRGLENVVAALDGDGDDNRKLLLALKFVTYDTMTNEAFGKEGQRGVGWSGIAARISTRAGKLRTQMGKENNPKIAEIVRRQADGLDELAAEIQNSGGQTPPKIFSER